MYNSEDYKGMMVALLPPGKITKDVDSNMVKLLDARSVGLAEIDVQASVFEKELIPSTDYPIQLLERFESIFGLPEKCVDTVQTDDERRQTLLDKMSFLGNLTTEQLSFFLQSNGFDVSIVEHWSFKAGVGVVNEKITNGGAGQTWHYVFEVIGEQTHKIGFKAGQNTAGEKISYFYSPEIACLVYKYKPAHTKDLYNFHDQILIYGDNDEQTYCLRKKDLDTSGRLKYFEPDNNEGKAEVYYDVDRFKVFYDSSATIYQKSVDLEDELGIYNWVSGPKPFGDSLEIFSWSVV